MKHCPRLTSTLFVRANKVGVGRPSPLGPNKRKQNRTTIGFIFLKKIKKNFAKSIEALKYVIVEFVHIIYNKFFILINTFFFCFAYSKPSDVPEFG